jgi:hypothetical protein
MTAATFTTRLAAADLVATGDRCIKFSTRLDAHLAALPNDDERRAFLTKQLDLWNARYDEFGERLLRGLEPRHGETAWDYAETIADISKRLAMCCDGGARG